jgi:hypothetical protein
VARLLTSVVLALSAAFCAIAQTATPWPEADRLFRSDPRWLGADAAYSVDLGRGRVLWLFGDSFVARKAGDTRRQSRMARNTVAIQEGYDPSTASIHFYWRETGSGSFFPDEGRNWFWPIHGIRIGNSLLLFFSIVKPAGTPGPFGFAEDGWAVFLIPNPDDEPPRWRIRRLDTPVNPWRIIAGISVLRERGQLYIWAAGEPKHDAYLARIRAADAARGNFAALQWWCGQSRGWGKEAVMDAPPEPVFHDAQMEFTVNRDGRHYVQLQTVGFGGTDISIRTADHLTGPWSALRKIHRPPESDLPGLWIYAAKSHPELHGAPLIVTYAQNADDARQASDLTIYFPRFVRVDLPK